MARSRSRSRKRMSKSIMKSGSSSRRREKTYSVTYHNDAHEPGYTYIVKAKSSEEAKELTIEYYIKRVIEKYDDPTYTGEKFIKEMADEDVIEEVKDWIKDIDFKFLNHHAMDNSGEINVDGMRFHYWGVEVTEIKLKGKVTPMFDETYCY